MSQYNKTNFHKHTFCVFEEKPLSEVSGMRPNHKSKSGSSYFFMESGVYRLSDHWGRAANCKWRLEAADKKHGLRLGFAFWATFHPDNETEKLYFIDYDPQTRTVVYQHKNNLKLDDVKTLFSAPEVTKRIREIRSLFASEAWARHFDGDIETLRNNLIDDIAIHGKTLQQAKSSLS
ncbi:hypothetical protein [Flavobacterium pallidum]|uniref:Uncharacterized protein n=1 Tax=Flavobacterium pallidum TaxID=2172098 RepID=A0A2S1SJP9_9FLAO|nr:hypothetical protein [Flavobacterium pallidum]AWI26654.1 hypothetical protein HYN49_12515 [Flavobacterium pallidum]